MKTVKKPTKAHKGKKVIKAHEGMAHVPKPSASKAKGTAGAAPRPKRRMIGLPQKFRGTTSKRQAELSNLRLDRAPNIEQVRAMFNASNKNSTPEQLKALREFKALTKKQRESGYLKDIKSQLTPKQIKAQRDAYERQRKGLPPARDPRVDNRTPRRLSAPRPQAPAPVRGAPAMQEPKVITQPKPAVRPPKIMDGDGFTRPIPRTMKQGGYVSRAKYGTVNNLKKGK